MRSQDYTWGQEYIASELEKWQERGYSSLQEACRDYGTDALKELAHIDEALAQGVDEFLIEKWQERAEFDRGILSRLD